MQPLSATTQVSSRENRLKERYDISSVLSRQPQNAGRRSCKSTAKVFRWNARSNPRHQKLSAGAIISNAGSHRSHHPATDAPRRSVVSTSRIPSDTFHPLLRPCDALRATVPGGYFVTTVIIFLSLRLIPRLYALRKYQYYR